MMLAGSNAAVKAFGNEVEADEGYYRIGDMAREFDVTLRTMRFIRGTERGETLIWRTPRPSSANAMRGCEAISPQTVTSR